jgi:hypothetical protein
MDLALLPGKTRTGANRVILTPALCQRWRKPIGKTQHEDVRHYVFRACNARIPSSLCNWLEPSRRGLPAMEYMRTVNGLPFFYSSIDISPT